MENKDLKEDRAPESVSAPEKKLSAEKAGDDSPDRGNIGEKKSPDVQSESSEEEKISNVQKGENPEAHKDGENTGNVQNESTEVKHHEANKEGERSVDVQKESRGVKITEPEKDRGAEDPTPDAGAVPMEEKENEPVFDGTENPEIGENGRHSESDLAAQGTAWPEKAAALKNYVVERGAAVGNFVRRLSSGRKEELDQGQGGSENNIVSNNEEDKKTNLFKDWNAWNPLTLVKNTLDANAEAKGIRVEDMPAQHLLQGPVFKGKVILFSCSESSDCRMARSFLRQKGLRYFEINIDVYPGRKAELEQKTGSSFVPKIFFNEVCLGGVKELKAMDASGELDEKIKGLMETEAPLSAPLPPSAEEEDFGNNGMVDEFESVVKNLRKHVVVKDRFYKMRMFSRCFVASDAVDFLAEDQLLERDEAVDFGRRIASKHFFHHVQDENIFDDGNHLYRFLEHDPVVSTKCYNFSGRTNDMKPKPAIDVAAKLRSLTLAIYAAYISDNGKHVDYRSIAASAEFVRYLKVTEDLQRIDLHDLSREEKLAFFINLYNMMAIHAIVLWGHPNGALERRRFFGDFKYVIGGYPYSLSAIQNGVLRGNQRPPYNLTKPFGLKDKRLKVALQIPEPLVHFALVSGSKSSPPFICYAPGSIDEELRLAARIFFNDTGFSIDADTNTASLSKIMKWYSVDFGNNEREVLKFVANYLEPARAEQLLGLLGSNQLKVTYQPYDWSLND
uniref:DEP domain-containing protein n=1 Tax=Araucaria cunninghamii TaxID=56994 RepID=A0A0D6R5A4_ARACU